jgi:monoamine oxidase
MFGSKYEEPIAFKRTNWLKDEFTYGAFSYPHSKVSKETFGIFNESVQDKIWFAGEATNY